MRPTASPPIQLALSLALLAALVCSGASCDSDFVMTSHGAVEDGNRALAAGEAEAALAAYQEAADEIPDSAELSFDRGLALSAAGKHDEATQMLLRGVGARDRELRRKVYAALGAAYARWALQIESETPPPPPPGAADGAPPTEPQDSGESDSEPALEKWEKAVEHLEHALVMDATDAAVLRNLEVALLRVDPPCARRDDDLEPNPGPDSAAAIDLNAEDPAAGLMSGGAAPSPASGDEKRWKRQLYSCPDDVDWYRVELEGGDRLAAEIEVSGAGELALSLFGPDGARQLRPPANVEEALSAFDFTAGGAGGTYYLEVDNVIGDEASYSLEVVVRPPCHKTEDRFEDNDVAAAAELVTPGPLAGLKICPADEDWYASDLAEGESLFVFASLAQDGEEDEEKPAAEAGDEPVPPALELEILDATGSERLVVGAPAGDARVATLMTPGEGRYLVRVVGAPELEARYDIMFQVIPPCPEGDDPYKNSNDRVEGAVDLVKAMTEQAQGGGGGAPAQGGPKPLFLRICPGDVDWFKLPGDPEKPLQLTAIFQHEKGDLEMVLYDADGSEEQARSDVSTAQTNGEMLMLPVQGVEEVTPYTVLVQGKEGADNFYLLKLDQPQGEGGQGDSQDQDQDQDQQDQDQQDQQDQQKKPEPKQEEPQQPRPLDDKLDEQDHNPRNLEAERARRNPLANHPPEKDW